MSKNDGSITFVRWAARIVAALGLGFVFVPIILSWSGKLSNGSVEFYVTGVGVPLLTFAGFLAVYLGFLSQESQNSQQEKHFKRDRFESTFFQLLRTHNQIVDDIRIEQKRKTTQKKGNGNDFTEKLKRELAGTLITYDREKEEIETIQITGRSCFAYFFAKFEGRFESEAEEKEWGDRDKTDESNVKTVYWKWFGDREAQLNHYFSNLSTLISFVNRSEVADNEFYMELISAQMSAPELKLFFYHITLMKGKSGHRYLSSTEEILEEYSFFERLDRRSLIHELHHELNEAAFGME